MVSRPILIAIALATAASFAAGWRAGLAAKSHPTGLRGPIATDPTEPGHEESAPPPEDPAFKQKILPFVEKYCLSCHNADKAAGGLTLEGYQNEAHARRNRKDWLAVQHAIAAGEMPPKKKAQPPKDEKEFVVSWIETALAKSDCTSPKDPGRVTIRRLNRAEYNNTIRDLCGVDFRPAEDFPADDVGYGFDNIGDVLSFQPILLEKYMTAADKVLDKALVLPTITPSRKQTSQKPEPAQVHPLLGTRPTRSSDARPAAEAALAKFARRAYRRPLKPEEVGRLMRLYDVATGQNEPFEKAIRLPMKAVLVSPHFLYRIEDDPKDPNGVRTLNDWEVATRLSYFLWSSMPDENLSGLADQGQLRDPAVLEAQIRRMLQDPKSRALSDNFAGQWLQLRNVKTIAPDHGYYPAWDESLRTGMVGEAEAFFEYVVRNDRSILDFLDADYMVVNERMAKHYGIPNVRGAQFRKVDLPNDRRGGIITMASTLTVTSNPTRTSPVKRGKWILENVLGTPPPPPAPDVPELPPTGQLKGTLRQQMEQHRANPSCATCHSKLDPLGFGLENFDGIGGWRTADNKKPIDSSGVLPDGAKFNGPAELRKVLLGKADLFRRCFAEKLLTFALGRGLEHYDTCAVNEIMEAGKADQDKFSALVLAVVKSDPFQKRKGKRSE